MAVLTGMAAVAVSARLQIWHVPNFWEIKYKKAYITESNRTKP